MFSSAQYTSVDSIFGPLSRIADPLTGVAAAAGPDPLTGNTAYSLAVLALFVGMCMLVVRYRGLIWSIGGLFKGGFYADKLLNGQSNMFDNFIREAIPLGLLALGLGGVRASDIAWGGEIAAAVPGAVVMLAPLLLAMALGAIRAVQWALLSSGGSVTLNTVLTDRLLRMRRIVFACATVALLPLTLVFAPAPDGRGLWAGVAMAAVVALAFIFLIARSLMLFVEQKISILLWFLYLCTVEIFPVSVPVLFVLKNI